MKTVIVAGQSGISSLLDPATGISPATRATSGDDRIIEKAQALFTAT
jgi:hypothetical protein